MIGDIKRGTEIGLMNHHKYVFIKCPDCPKERWIQIRNGKPANERCHTCGARNRALDKSKWKSGKDAPNWRGGRGITPGGYIKVKIKEDNPYFSMAWDGGYIFEHRLVMARQLGRCLLSEETVHHRNKNRKDNRPENLEILNRNDHSSLQKEVIRLTIRIRELEEEIVTLRRL